MKEFVHWHAAVQTWRASWCLEFNWLIAVLSHWPMHVLTLKSSMSAAVTWSPGPLSDTSLYVLCLLSVIHHILLCYITQRWINCVVLFIFWDKQLASCLINAQPLPAHRPTADDNSCIGCTRPRLTDDWSLPSANFIDSWCPFRCSFVCVLLLNQMFWKQCTVLQYQSDLADQSALEIGLGISVRLRVALF